jgi:DNA repair protein RecO (recombination protein O)
MRVNLQPAYIIHRRPYRDTSALLEVFTAEYGRISLVARGASRQSRKGSNAALLQSFVPLLVSFSGRMELKTMVAIEPAEGKVALAGDRLFSGMYINELLVRLLHRNDAHPALFAAYSAALKALDGVSLLDTVLRCFELALLEELGYRLELDVDGVSGQQVEESRWYRYEPAHGLVASEGDTGTVETAFAGTELLAMASGEFSGSVRLPAKRLLREALAVHLGDEPLRSRELFQAGGGKSLNRLGRMSEQ